jgi:hypothetical protein
MNYWQQRPGEREFGQSGKVTGPGRRQAAYKKSVELQAGGAA